MPPKPTEPPLVSYPPTLVPLTPAVATPPLDAPAPEVETAAPPPLQPIRSAQLELTRKPTEALKILGIVRQA